MTKVRKHMRKVKGKARKVPVSAHTRKTYKAMTKQGKVIKVHLKGESLGDVREITDLKGKKLSRDVFPLIPIDNSRFIDWKADPKRAESRLKRLKKRKRRQITKDQTNEFFQKWKDSDPTERVEMLTELDMPITAKVFAHDIGINRNVIFDKKKQFIG